MSSSSSLFASGTIEIDSPNVTYTPEEIVSTYNYETTSVSIDETTGRIRCVPTSETLKFVTDRHVPRTGVMFVGWGGNNGTTVTGGILANRHGLTWRTKTGVRKADYVGSLTQSSTVRLGSCAGKDVYVPFNSMLPMVSPNDLVITGWDISSLNLGDAMERAAVMDVDLQNKLYPYMKVCVTADARVAQCRVSSSIAASWVSAVFRSCRGCGVKLCGVVRAWTEA